MRSPVCRLKLTPSFCSGEVRIQSTCNNLLQDLREKTEVGYWPVIFHVFFVKVGLLQQRRNTRSFAARRKTPSESDRLSIDVIGVTRTSMQSFTRVVGIGSRSQDYMGMSKQSAVPEPRKQGQSREAQREYQEGLDWLYSSMHAKGTQRV